VIQRSSERALSKKVNLTQIFSLVKSIRQKSDTPILLMGYFNPILSYGIKEFCDDLKNAGGDAVLVVDLPPEESGDFQEELKKNGLHQIFLLAPTSRPSRINEICKMASGFIYYISLEGTTGGKMGSLDAIQGQLEKIRQKTKLPLVVGFGIRNAEQAKALSQISDGVVVGSSIIEKIENKPFPEGLKDASQFVRELKQEL